MSITPKSHDFIEGYIFSEVESSLIGAFHGKEQRWNRTVTIPKSWFGLRAIQNELVMLPEHEQSKLRLEIKDILSQMNNNLRSYEYTVIFRASKQYIRIEIEGVYIEPIKEMTIEQIEKELGYKIKVVSNK